ncbi:FAD-dependent oxidoreductase [Biostraticola tofi]|uniref:NAD/ferredoxin-dependent reductase-like protein n=1 Tax=Biostraticola tofi TaxID=466109 RepID=A0A4R3YTA1_9GAMM|nr:FAD-dependent oxidoreductase [Biostraticola tofi]TCV94343.1 NAD/ferredoxin-dependent reductase-like protein [Biostraticola tofi]
MAYQNVMSLSNLAELTPKKVSVGDTDVLLLRKGDEVYALEATCPHAGAPLEKGAVCEGKLVCPWHKSVFTLEKGQLCEPPSLRSLNRYPVKIEQDALWVDAEPEGGQSALQKIDEDETFVVLGVGAGGSAAIKALREKGYQGRLVVIEREKQAPYDRTTLSKFVPQGDMSLDEVPSLLNDAFYQQQQVERINGNVASLDTQRRHITLDNGTVIHYQRLLLSTGGIPQRPELPGKALQGVAVLRSWEQAAALIPQVEKQQRLVIIGNSFIGMEVAAAFRKQDIDVTVISPHPLPFEKNFGPELATFFRRRHQQKGVRFVDGEPVALQGDKTVSSVKLKQGADIPAQLVLLATGVAPATDFISDLPLNKDGSLTVDASMAAGKDVFAIGDIATFPHKGEPVRIEHWRVAQQHGRVAAGAMLDNNDTYDSTPFFWTQQYGVRYEYIGHAEAWDKVDIIGDLDKDDFVALYVKDEKVVAVVGAGRMRTTGLLLMRLKDELSLVDARKIVDETVEDAS